MEKKKKKCYSRFEWRWDRTKENKACSFCAHSVCLLNSKMQPTNKIWSLSKEEELHHAELYYINYIIEKNNLRHKNQFINVHVHHEHCVWCNVEHWRHRRKRPIVQLFLLQEKTTTTTTKNNIEKKDRTMKQNRKYRNRNNRRYRRKFPCSVFLWQRGAFVRKEARLLRNWIIMWILSSLSRCF